MNLGLIDDLMANIDFENQIENENCLKILNLMENYIKEIAKTNNLEVKITNPNYYYFTVDGDKRVCLEMFCNVNKVIECNTYHDSLNIEFDNRFSYTDVVFDEENNQTSFSFFTTNRMKTQNEERNVI